MYQGSRLKKIGQFLEEHLELTVLDACKLYNASPATIRRDFNNLIETGQGIKIWGGIAKNSNHPDNLMLPVTFRQTLFADEKRKIASKAVELIKDGDVIIIDGGTTTFFMTKHLANMPVKVITNSILIANQIDQERHQKQGAEVFLTGGFLYPEASILVGPQAILNIKEYHAKWAFLSVGGIEKNQATNSNQLVVEMERAIISQSENIVMLADHSKFGKRSMIKLCSMSDIDILITDNHKDTKPIISDLKSIVELKVIVVD